ncbi:MAG: hypothetical protein K2N06_00680 [Oscillospiraceae bacterium]|nr:hypothetical protein [Oscillospiraceae bacterium]
MWVKGKTASGFLTLDNLELTAENLPEVLNNLKANFGGRLTLGGEFGLNGDSVAFELRIDRTRITMGYDIWSGAFIMAWDSAGDKIIEEIESFLR